MKSGVIAPRRINFRSKLYAGFFSIALLTLFITGFALYLFNQFGSVVNTTAGEAIPELQAVMKLSSNSALLAAVAPVLTASRSEQELHQVENQLNILEKTIRINLESLSASSSHRNTFDSIRTHSSSISTTLIELKNATLERLGLRRETQSGLRELRSVQGELVDTLNPIVYGATSLSNLFARRGARRNAMLVKNLVQTKVKLVFELLNTQRIAYRLENLFENQGNLADDQWKSNCSAETSSLKESLVHLDSFGSDAGTAEIAVLIRTVINIVPCRYVSRPVDASFQVNAKPNIRNLIEILDTEISKRQARLQDNYLDAINQVKALPTELANKTIRNLRYALDIKAEGNLLIGLLTAVTDADNQHNITNLFNRFRVSIESFRNAVRIFQSSELAERNPILLNQVLNLEERLSKFGAGSDDFFSKRRSELSLSEHINSLLATHREQATRMTTQANRLVADVQKNVFELQHQLDNKLAAAILILVAVCAGSLLLAASIAYITTVNLSRHESDLRDANRAAELLNQELDTFNYSVSHDLRAPLRSLSGFSQALIEDYGDKLDEEGKTYLRYLQESSEEMEELISGLLQLSRSTRGAIALQRVNLSSIAKTIADTLRKNYPDRDVKVQIMPDLVVSADRRLIVSVMENLLGNAWKYTGGKKHAEIFFGHKIIEGESVFFVQDDGAGFDMNHASKLFQPFQRLHRDDEFKGTGIGLATVQRIIRRHGGSIWTQSEVDKGTTFFFTIGKGHTQ